MAATEVPGHTLLVISPEAWLTILAIFLGPITALLVQKRVEIAREKRERQVELFRRLMANRGAILSQPYVQALNSIEVEFFGNRSIIDAWHELVDHYNTAHDPNDDAFKRWVARLNDLATNMLYAMGESLGFHFDRVTLQKNAYTPQAWGDLEAEMTKLRKAAINVFEGRSKLKVETSDEPPPLDPFQPPR